MENMEWMRRCAGKTCEMVLKTIDHIIEDADKHLTDDELDKLKDCWKILHLMGECK